MNKNKFLTFIVILMILYLTVFSCVTSGKISETAQITSTATVSKIEQTAGISTTLPPKTSTTSPEILINEKFQVVTKYATYVGVKDQAKGVISFKGITYAVADKWQPPREPEKSEKVIIADKFGDAPWQNSTTLQMSNNCLNLNIWMADNDLKNKSVYMYVYGGAQIGGSNQSLDWSNFVAANPDIIVVTPNHRVGFWGSLDLSQLEGYKPEVYKYSNNLARLDLLQCLKWINENISAFGGNPNDVTIGGHSSGSNNVTCLLYMEESHKYFQKAICQESFAIDVSLTQLKDAKFVSKDLFNRLGVTTLNELLACPDEKILAVQNEIQKASMSGSSAYANIESKLFAAVIDDVVIPSDYYQRLLDGSAKGIKVMLGSNAGTYDQQYTKWAENKGTNWADALQFSIEQNWGKLSSRGWNSKNAQAIIDEFMSHNEEYERNAFTAAKDLKNDLQMRLPGIMLAEAMSRYTDVYLYYLEWDTNPNDVDRAAHGSENPIITRNWSNLSNEMIQTANMISNTWAQFIRSGNPNNKDLNRNWSPYSVNTNFTLHLTDYPVTVRGIRPKDTATLLPLLREYPLLVNAKSAKVSKPGTYTGYSPAYYNGYNRYSKYVSVSDGTKIAIDYYIPTRNGVEEKKPLPVVWEFTPYNRVSYNKDGTLNISPNVDWFTSYGYVVAIADCRGTGASYGTRDAANSRREAQDGHDITEWLAKQPFCNGKVGMYGASYTGQTQLATISTQPGHLVCAVVGCTDFNKYDGWVRGGIPRAFGSNPDIMWTAIGGDVTVQSVVDRTVPVDGDYGKIMLYEAVSQHVLNGLQIPMFQKLLWRNSFAEEVNGEYWNMVSASSYIKEINNSGVAVYLLGGLYDVFRRDTFVMYKNLTVPKKMTIGPWYHVLPKTEVDWKVEQLRWFDYWLKGIQNGVVNEDPIYLKTANGTWEFYQDWPVGSGTETIYFLTQGTSGTAKSVNDDILTLQKTVTSTYVDYKAVYGFKTGVESTSSAEIDAGGLTFTTAPLTQDFKITGHPMAHIYFELLSKGYNDIDIFITLVDYDPKTGQGFIFSDGHLRASLRSTQSPPYDFLGLPWHRANREDASNITTGKVYKLEIDLMPTSYIVKQGHCIRVTITNSLDRFYYLGYTEYQLNPTGYDSPTMRIHTGGQNSSFIVLPDIYK